MRSPRARELAIVISAVSPETLCGEVFKRFLLEPETQFIPVIEKKWPVGLIARQDFLLRYMRMYGAELYGRRPVSHLMQREIVLVEGRTRCEKIDVRAEDQYGNPVLRPFIVMEDGAYAGVGDTTKLMLAIADLASAHAAALEEQTKRAEAASRSKTEFLANMSHELRTPLNAIIGFADLIRLHTFGEIQPMRYGEYVEDIHRSGLHLLNMINELLDMAKIEAGHVELDEAVFHPFDVGLYVLRMLRQSIADARLQVRIDIADELPWICADEQLIRRVLINLLSNAIKYTPPGGSITLSMRVYADVGMELVVADTGIGIPENMLEKVLEPFEQVENSFTRTRPGTGLGLSLTKAMMEMHGGRLWLESEVGTGTRAHISLPASRIVWKLEEPEAVTA